jgi:hypothetical protein
MRGIAPLEIFPLCRSARIFVLTSRTPDVSSRAAFADENDPLGKSRLSAFTQALADLGWADGRNVRMDLRWAGGDTNRIRALA